MSKKRKSKTNIQKLLRQIKVLESDVFEERLFTGKSVNPEVADAFTSLICCALRRRRKKILYYFKMVFAGTVIVGLLVFIGILIGGALC